MTDKMRLMTNRLILEPLGIRHFSGTCRYSMDPDNTAMMCYLPCDDEEEVRNYLVKSEAQWNRIQPDYLDAAVLLNGTHIGAVSIEMVENRSAGELGWIIDKRFWGSGYAAEAAAAFMDYFSRRFSVTRFIAHCDEENYASRRVMEKLGMTLTDTYSGRKNRNSPAIRRECLFRLEVKRERRQGL